MNEELDGGEIILQGKVPILPDDDIVSLTKAIQRQEYAILPAAIEYVKNSRQSNHVDNAKYQLQESNSWHLLSYDKHWWWSQSARTHLDV